MEGLSTASYLQNIRAMLAITVGTVVLVNHLFRRMLYGRAVPEKAPPEGPAKRRGRLTLLRPPK